MSSPKISIIVPVYNTSAYLKDNFDSLKNQTMGDIEIIYVDDASTDNSLEMLRAFARSELWISYIKHNAVFIKILYGKPFFRFYNSVCHRTASLSFIADFSVMSATAFAKSSAGFPSRFATIAVTSSFDMGT